MSKGDFLPPAFLPMPRLAVGAAATPPAAAPPAAAPPAAAPPAAASGMDTLTMAAKSATTTRVAKRAMRASAESRTLTSWHRPKISFAAAVISSLVGHTRQSSSTPPAAPAAASASLAGFSSPRAASTEAPRMERSEFSGGLSAASARRAARVPPGALPPRAALPAPGAFLAAAGFGPAAAGAPAAPSAIAAASADSARLHLVARVPAGVTANRCRAAPPGCERSSLLMALKTEGGGLDASPASARARSRRA